MSIIHEALKKAEREREPLAEAWPPYRGMKTTRRRWPRGMTGGILIGTIAMGVIGGWLWMPPLGDRPRPTTVIPDTQSAPAAGLTTRGEVGRHPVISPTPMVAEPPEELSHTQSSDIPSRTAPMSIAVEAQATAEAAFEKAKAAESKGQWEPAEEYYRQALILNPTFIEARNNLGTLYIRRQLLSAAINEFLAALAVDPNYAMARNNLGSAYFLKGDETQAIQEFLAALSIDGVYVSPYYNLATLYARRGQAGHAIAFLTRALALDPAVMSWLQTDPDFDGIRTIPEFQHLRSQGFARR